MILNQYGIPVTPMIRPELRAMLDNMWDNATKVMEQCRVESRVLDQHGNPYPLPGALKVGDAVTVKKPARLA